MAIAPLSQPRQAYCNRPLSPRGRVGSFSIRMVRFLVLASTRGCRPVAARRRRYLVRPVRQDPPCGPRGPILVDRQLSPLCATSPADPPTPAPTMLPPPPAPRSAPNPRGRSNPTRSPSCAMWTTREQHLPPRQVPPHRRPPRKLKANRRVERAILTAIAHAHHQAPTTKTRTGPRAIPRLMPYAPSEPYGYRVTVHPVTVAN
jgi:hypothetical protein